MNDKDKRSAETIIDYCNRINDYLNRFDDDKEIYMSDSLYKDACALVIIRWENLQIDFPMNFLKSMMELNGVN